MRRLLALSALLVMAQIALLDGSAFAADPSGTWIMANGKVTVRVSKCSSNLCARIVGLQEPRDKLGRAKVDRLNPNPALRNRRLIGLPLATLTPSGSNKWSGRIYNPDDGRTYAASLAIDGQTLRVKGCVAGVLCKTSEFKRKK